jgi:D-sedoheptulose 7-phosphate isomerase
VPNLDRLEKARALLRAAAELHAESAGLLDGVLRVVDLIASAYRAGNKVLLFGNGGSAAGAQHMAAELVGRLRFDRPSLPAIALTTNSSSLTAIANDYSFDEVFERSVEAFAEKGDIVIAMSTSGESRNVLRGVTAAKRKGALTVAFCGQKGGLSSLCDVSLAVPSTDTPRIQEVHVTLGHIVCELVEQDLFATRGKDAGGRLPRSR